MNKTTKVISYILTIIFLVYMIIITSFNLIWFYSGEATDTPAILLFIYVTLSSIYFIRIGYIKLKK